MFSIVKVNVEVEPFTIGSGEKDLAMVGGGVGSPQPVTVTLSICIFAFRLLAPLALILKYVRLEPVAAAS